MSPPSLLRYLGDSVPASSRRRVGRPEKRESLSANPELRESDAGLREPKGLDVLPLEENGLSSPWKSLFLFSLSPVSRVEGS